ncbi:MAG: RHS repeat-associated core domain-containing protein [Firmicutes bacterium]|nr:RHS repeat-associated core domain-containing protein [Bacillota bacterium]
MPNGDISIEKSKGNLLFSQEDISIDNDDMPFEISRVYNSQSSAVSAFGPSWSHNYDLELLSVCEGPTSEMEQIAYRDDTGGIILFSKGQDGKFISNLGKYMILEEDEQTEEFTIPARGNIAGDTRTVESAYTLTTKDGDEYRFDASGTLVLYEDNNENPLFFDYDPETGLLTKVTTGRNISLDISYCDGTGGTNPLCIDEISMPDGGSISYSYDNDGMLESAVRHASSGSGTITYSFDYSNTDNSYPSLSEMTDANSNDYQVSYTGKKASQITYPDASALKLVYSDHSTVTTKEASNLTMDTQTDWFNDEGNCIRSVDKNGLETLYSYENDMLVETRSQVEYEELEEGQVVVKNDYVTDTADYDDDKYLTEEEDESGNTTEYEYYSTTGNGACEGQICSETEESGDGVTTSDTTYQYDTRGNEVLSEDSVTGEKTVTEYYGDNAGNGIAGQVKKETEYKNDIQTTVTNYSYSYNNAGCLTETETEVSDGYTTVDTTVYDEMGRTVSESKNNGEEVTTYTYDGFGRQTGTSHTVGNETKTTQTTYDANGNMLSQTAEDGTLTTNVYDSMNRSISTIVSNDGVSTTTASTYSYQSISVNGSQVNTEVTQTNTDGVISKTYSDGEDVVKEESNGMSTVYDLDASGNTVAEYTVGTLGGQRLDTAYVTDIHGEQVCEIEDPDVGNGNYIVAEDSVLDQTTYDSLGNTKTEEENDGNITSYSYDAQSRETRVELPDGTGRDISYTIGNDGSEKETVEDANGNTSETITSPGGNETKVSNKGDGTVDSIEKTYTYDADGNVTRQDEAEGNYKTFTYNAKGENTVVNCFDKNGVNTLRTQYTYDDSGNMLTMKDFRKDGDDMVMFRYAKFGYDGLGRKISEVVVYGEEEPSQSELAERTITYQYDSKGRVSSVGYPSVLSDTYSVTGLRYIYDNFERLSQIKVVMGSGEELLREYVYDQYGIITEKKDYRDFADGGSDYISCQYSYDDLGRVTSMEYSDSSDNEVFESYALTYDKAGNITREETLNGLPANEEEQVNEIREHEYDSLGRLIATEVTSQPDGDTVRTEYTYDSVGNRHSMTEGDNVTEYTYNSLDQLTGTTVTEDGATTFETESEYDKNGNLVSQETEASNDGVTETETKEYTYDPNNMMTGCTISQEGTISVDQSCMYDGDGQRTYKADGDDNTRYYYMGGNVLYTESDVAIQPEEGDGDGDGAGNDEEDSVETKITSFNLMRPEGGVIATGREMEGSDKYFTYTKDVRGSTTNIISDAGVCVANYTYTDFGDTSAGEDTDFDNEICYTGGIYDDSTGEYYLNARYYDPADGRFTTQDSYRGENTDDGTWNLYTYCENSPLIHVDPSGHAAIVLKSNFMGENIGHLAVLIKHKGNWRYFSWGIKGYKSPYIKKKWKANTKKYKSVKKGRVKKAINKRFKRTKKSEKYRKYLYIKGNFRKSFKYIEKVSKGKSFRKYGLHSVNCAWMVLQVLRKGNIGKKKKKKLRNMQYGYAIDPETGNVTGEAKNIVIPNRALNQLKNNVFGGTIRKVE